MLHEHWPAMSIEYYMQMVSKSTTDSSSSFILLLDGVGALGFVRLQPTNTSILEISIEIHDDLSTQQCPAVASYVIIDKAHRGNGYGRVLMTLMEDYIQCNKLHTYLYIEADGEKVADFYKKLEFRLCERAGAVKSCLLYTSPSPRD